MRATIAWGLLALYGSGMGAAGAEEEEKAAEAGKKANRLLEEKSPYLLQHAYNPVDWYPWGEEAFAKARQEEKPILLSVGYSTCHWCHVMERESFENEEIAKFLNEHFVSIKLDREERPDVDRVYMTAYQAMSGEGGGWPLNMMLTPDLKPFFGGTYFPPESKRGRPGFLEVLQQIRKVWSEQREEVLKTANTSHEQMQKYFEERPAAEGGAAELSAQLVADAVKEVAAAGDERNGGWGSGPKFPQPSNLRLLMRAGGEKERAFALKTCRKMMHGGIYDQIGGGFHRYAVDGIWLVPHFEKMLYDQAQLVDVYLDAWQISGDEGFKRVATETLDWVLRDMRHKDGGFFSAADAQSEGKEGKYWAWTEAELEKLLEAEELKAVKRHYGVTPTGNFIDHSDPDPLPDQNVLYVTGPTDDWTEAERKALESAVAKMRAARAKRVPPAVDDKVLASWNGLMIAAMARAGRTLGEDRYLEAAEKAHAFVVAKLWDGKQKVLYHRWREGERDDSQQAESYLYFLRGTRLLYETTLEADYLALAVDLAEGARKRLYDRERGGFFDGEKRKDLVLRLKDDFDSAMPTPSSVGAMEFAVLAEITGRKEFGEVSEKTLAGVGPALKESPFSVAEALRAVDFLVAKPSRLVITGGDRRREFL
ncbi:MAG: thioredoxin domain-containing protein, partial [Akkermansiaceae bacterium]|nr:thioredoxin domain-containing protein [Akkermansiaceae bacterium]